MITTRANMGKCPNMFAVLPKELASSVFLFVVCAQDSQIGQRHFYSAVDVLFYMLRSESLTQPFAEHLASSQCFVF